MKAFLQHDESGLFYRSGGEWVPNTEQALAFLSAHEAEQFRRAREIRPARAVLRIDPALLARVSRAPGLFQMGE
jgi:hypothetical protein